uniref:Variant surface glycoprotein 1259 n=1 Tax=Trypanosoma brucei TaxID=5691 RepID=M4SVY4_9TRYP|nr:variant surface glycoprotein 1259 [Trypanosoma brucei]
MAYKLTCCAIQSMALATLIAVRPTAAVDGDNGENTLEFNALCRLLRAAQAGLQESSDTLPAGIEKTFNDIAMAAKLAYTNTTAMGTELKALQEDKKKWPQYLPDTPSTDRTKRAINHTYLLAEKIRSAANTDIENHKISIAEANKLLGEAVSGKKVFPPNYNDDGNFLTAATSADVFGPMAGTAKNCGGTGGGSGNGNNVGRTLVNDIVCLCCVTASGSKKLCGKKTGSANQASPGYDNPGSSIKAAFAGVMALCPKRQTRTTTAELQALLAAVENLIGRQAGEATTADDNAAYILGLADNQATGCTGADKQVCVNYKLQLAGSSATGIPWRNKIQEAITKAGSDSTLRTKLAQAESTLEHINNTMWQAYDTAFVAAECKQQKPKKTCEEKGCKWNGTQTDGTCEAKEREEQANTAGTGDGAAAGCARHQNQPDCANDKTGEKQNCA